LSYRLVLGGASVAVTGGARGIGRATVASLAAAGARVAIGDIDHEAARQAAVELDAEIAALELDVADPDSVEAFVAAAERAHGPLDAFVANAGLLPLGPFLDTDPALHRRAVEVNLLGTINCLHAALPGMVERGAGRVVLVASLMGRITAAGAAVYGATKHAVVALAEALREELRGGGIDVVTVLPAIVRTEAAAGVGEGRGIPAVEPEEVAATIVRACERGGGEIPVPRWAGPLARAGGTLPPELMRPIRWALRGDRALRALDEGDRASYERRLRESSRSGPDDQSPSS
jgi:NAD(P)-dependent dehydrogenase (short-subunit alcohol dehydrogenase family)